MNHDPNPTSPAEPHSSPNRRRRDDEDDIEPQNPERGQQNGSSPSARATRQRPHLSKRAKEGLTKKLDLLLHLLLSLDTLIFAEICTVYYMDCSFAHLLIRWIPHWLFLSVKSNHIVVPQLNYPVGAIVGPNALVMFLHLIMSLPTAGEAARGYLHGGVLVDFVGQKPPSSKFSLLLLDALLLGLQCFMLAVNLEKDRIKKIINPTQQQQAAAQGVSVTIESNAPTGQDHDSEERGVLRDAPTVDGAGDIEMQSLNNNDDRDEERATLLERPRDDSYDDLSDALSSGNAILADLHVRNALRTAWNDRRNTSEAAAAYTLQNVGYNATLAALAAQRRARLATAQTGVQVSRA